ncbi:MAG: phosphate regulon sensor histidine kinase PhoR [Pseudomonadota bacterium]
MLSESWRKILAALIVVLLLGGILGWAFGRAETGVLIAALAFAGWQLRQMFLFERAVRQRDNEAFRNTDGYWGEVFSHVRSERRKSTRNKKRYRDLLSEIRKSANAMPDAAVIVDKNNEILMCNRAAQQLVGLRPKKDRGKRVDSVLKDQDLKKLLRSKSYKASVDIESPLRKGDWLNYRVVPYGADQKLLLIRDVTERLRIHKMRRDFVANASHELRSPLTVISGYLEGVDDEELPEDWRYRFGQMQSQAARMNQVVSELLELSRLESAGRASLDVAVDVAGLMSATAAAYGGKGVPTLRVRADASMQLLGNATQIESVITNLLTNAIRHTPPDGTITLTWSADSGGGVISVSDTGEGIADKYLPRLSERFFRVDRGRARADGGVGLGLAIVKHILHRHDGELRVTSEVGKGSTFFCEVSGERIRERSEAAKAS